MCKRIEALVRQICTKVLWPHIDYFFYGNSGDIPILYLCITSRKKTIEFPRRTTTIPVNSRDISSVARRCRVSILPISFPDLLQNLRNFFPMGDDNIPALLRVSAQRHDALQRNCF